MNDRRRDPGGEPSAPRSRHTAGGRGEHGPFNRLGRRRDDLHHCRRHDHHDGPVGHGQYDIVELDHLEFADNDDDLVVHDHDGGVDQRHHDRAVAMTPDTPHGDDVNVAIAVNVGADGRTTAAVSHDGQTAATTADADTPTAGRGTGRAQRGTARGARGERQV